MDACGGGGAVGGGEKSASGVKGSDDSATVTFSQSLSAGGVTAGVDYDTTSSAVSLSVTKGDTEWTDIPTSADVQAAPSGWVSKTRLNAPAATASERFRVVAKIDSATDNDDLAYGYWSRVSLESPDDFKSFYHGKTPYTGNGEEQTGSAAYTGGATGV